jgi:hypothetical protein
MEKRGYVTYQSSFTRRAMTRMKKKRKRERRQRKIKFTT